ncbi:MaoC family dehydratase [Salsipaludibacter albus]|uniref:MaoC family dehydratase n=1 Tax=Salsipaludibacter albus TaxID=2849650 RepID=UPI001EE4A9A7|nr:MaoC family dehydratase [Salsipaludibacter albus]MBY5161984.1 MaoC family dehydratase [Salsipaludibacter albus]
MPVTMTMDELATAADVDLGASEWIDVTQDLVDRFADATDDHQWIHVDPERAADGMFGGTIAHGFWTLAMLPSLLGGLMTVPDAAMGINYGLDRVRLPAPVPVGSRVRAVGRLDHTEPKAGGLLVHVDVTIEIEDSDRPALVGRFLSVRV